MPDDQSSLPLATNVKPIAPEPVPFTEYGDIQPKTNHKNWRKWLLVALSVVTITMISLFSAILLQGEVKVAGMVLRNPFTEHNVSENHDSVINVNPTPTPISSTLQNVLLEPLDLDSVTPQLVIVESNQKYFIDYDGSNKTPTSIFDASGMMDSSNTCAYYVNDRYGIYRGDVSGDQDQLVVELDPKLFEVPTDYRGHTGPGYGIEIKGVDASCRQAVVSIYMNAATDDMPQEGTYLIAPEQKQGLIRLDSNKTFIEFINNKPMFHSGSRVFTVNLNGIFSEPYAWPAPIGFQVSEFNSMGADGLLVDSVSLYPGEDSDFDPTTGQAVKERVNKIVEVDLNTGNAKAISPNNLNFYQQVRISPDSKFVFYARETGESAFNIPTQEVYILDRTNSAAHKLNVSKGSLSSGVVWLDQNTFVFSHRTVPTGPQQYQNAIMKCSAVTFTCESLTSGLLSFTSHY